MPGGVEAGHGRKNFKTRTWIAVITSRRSSISTSTERHRFHSAQVTPVSVRVNRTANDEEPWRSISGTRFEMVFPSAR